MAEVRGVGASEFWGFTISLSVGMIAVFFRLVDYPVAEVGSKDVSVDMMMCAINPADINQIQGV